MNNTVPTLAFSLIVLALNGCDTVKAPRGASQDPLPIESYPTVVLEAGIDEALVVNYPGIVVRPPANSLPLAVSVPIRSKADVQMRIQYEFRWYDDRNVELATSGLQVAVIEPRREIQIQANALTSKAERWRLEVRAAR